MLWGRVTYEMMESYWPAVARGDEEAMHDQLARLFTGAALDVCAKPLGWRIRA